MGELCEIHPFDRSVLGQTKQSPVNQGGSSPACDWQQFNKAELLQSLKVRRRPAMGKFE